MIAANDHGCDGCDLVVLTCEESSDPFMPRRCGLCGYLFKVAKKLVKPRNADRR